MSLKPIPEGAKITIKNEYTFLVQKLRDRGVTTPMTKAQFWKDGAEYGYQLAQQELSDLRKEIDLLEQREVAWSQKVGLLEEQLEQKQKTIEQLTTIIDNFKHPF